MNSNSMLFFMDAFSWNPQMQMLYLWNLQNQFQNQNIQKSQQNQLPSFEPFKPQEPLQIDNSNYNQVKQTQKRNKRLKNQKPQELWSSKDFNPRKQKSERNVRSNALKYFLKYLESYEANTKRIQRLINHYNIKEYSPEIFMMTLKQKFLSCKNYIRPNYVKSLIKDSDQHFAKIFRIFFRIFAKSEKLMSLAHCKKLKAKAKLHHGNVAKKLFKSSVI